MARVGWLVRAMVYGEEAPEPKSTNEETISTC